MNTHRPTTFDSLPRDPACTEPLARWIATGLLRSADVALAARIARLDGGVASWEIVLAFALVLRSARGGSALLDLAALRVDELLASIEPPPPPDLPTPALPALAAWCDALAARPRLVASTLPTDATATTPFVLRGTHLAHARAWNAETRVARHTLTRMEPLATPTDGAQADEPAPEAHLLPNVTDAVLGLITGDGADAQRAAAQRGASDARLTLVIGGPGTGKTYTVRAMITLAWLSRAILRDDAPDFDVRLAAPTGKAAQRMREAMTDGLDDWCQKVAESLGSIDGLSARAPTLAKQLHAFLAALDASTLHRLLGYQRHNPTRFQHRAQQPLGADLVVVDEVSMVDLTLMSQLLDAVAPESALVLVGDRRQLASVEAGTVLADLCTAERTRGKLVVELTTSRRFPADSPVGRFAAASEALDQVGDDPTTLREHARNAASALARAADERAGGVRIDWDRTPGRSSLDAALDDVADYWAQVMKALQDCTYRVDHDGRISPLDAERGGIVERLAWGDQDPPTDASVGRIFQQLTENVRMLSAHRRGPAGVQGLNADLWTRIRARLQRLDGRVGRAGEPWDTPREGVPLIVTRNDRDLGRYNGDVGLWVRVRHTETGDGMLVAVFPRDGDHVDLHSPARLPDHEVVWAMTVHKSQGSEFRKVVFVMPETDSPIWTRELVYTAITRVRNHLVLVGSEARLAGGLTRRIRRASGLRERLASA